MKKSLFVAAVFLFLTLNANAQTLPGKKDKKEEKKEDSNIQEENKDGKSKDNATLTPHKPTGVATVDNLGNSSYNLAKSTDSLKKEALFIRIETKEIPDEKLGTVTELKCFSSTGEEIPCQKLDKEESLRKFQSILASLGEIGQQIPTFVALIPNATSEVTSLSSNPMKAAVAAKATASLKNIGEQLKITGVNVAELTTNVNAAIKALNLIKKQ